MCLILINVNKQIQAKFTLTKVPCPDKVQNTNFDQKKYLQNIAPKIFTKYRSEKKVFFGNN